jgi:hypothetical protein
MERAEDYVRSVQERLERAGFKLIREAALPGGWKCDLVAARTYFSWKGFIFLSQYVFLAQVDKPAPADARRLFDAGLEYCQGGGDLPIRFRGLQAGGMIVPCLVSPSVDATVVEFAGTIPRKHWAPSSNFPCSTTCPRARRTIAGRRGSGADCSTPIFTSWRPIAS